jgi:hypothetical protein
MKIYFIILILPILFSACAHKSAFDDFNITKKQELSEEQLQNAKIQDTNATTGLVSALYLNKIDNKKFHDKEYFYIALYIQNIKENKIEFLLNSKEALNVKQLPNPNQFTNLTDVDAKWLEYYLVVFKKEKGELKLQIKDNNSSSRVLLFKQEE